VTGESAPPVLADAGFDHHASATVGVETAALLAATLDLDPRDHAREELTVPLPWHWTCFLPSVRTDALGPDGHPRRRPETAAFPRRMWVGGRVRELRPLRVGEPAERASELRNATLKDGASGRFWLLTVAHTVTQAGLVCIEEEQDLALREAPTSPAPSPGREIAAPPGGSDADWVDTRAVDAVLLFRYSALTFNAHRIHYDLPYATAEEGYPALVVQGPLVATLLCETARAHVGGAVRELSFRARVPLFAPARVWLTGRRTDVGADLAAVRNDGETAMTMTTRCSELR
jgi:3-methylfumaryl-CoA hydratase